MKNWQTGQSNITIKDSERNRRCVQSYRAGAPQGALADHIADALVAEKLTVISPSPVETRLAASIARDAPTLSQTDCLTLACARERHLTLVMEERRGRNVAMLQGIAYMTIQVLPLHGL